MDIKLITKQTMYKNLKGKEVCIVKMDTDCRAAIGLPVYGTFSRGLRGRKGGFSIIVPEIYSQDYHGISEHGIHEFYTDKKTKYGQSSDKTLYIVYMRSIGVAYGIRIID